MCDKDGVVGWLFLRLPFSEAEEGDPGLLLLLIFTRRANES